MEMKRVLKPGPLKILFFLLVFITMVPFLEYDMGIRCITVPCPTSEFGPLISFFLRSPTFYVFNVYWPFLFLGILLSYLVPAFLVEEIREFRSL